MSANFTEEDLQVLRLICKEYREAICRDGSSGPVSIGKKIMDSLANKLRGIYVGNEVDMLTSLTSIAKELNLEDAELLSGYKPDDSRNNDDVALLLHNLGKSHICAYI